MDEFQGWSELKEALIDLHEAISMGRNAEALDSLRQWCFEHELEIGVLASGGLKFG
jgi:hypothetical protein